jgi:chemotaxis protein methyltransferase CheR
MLMEKLDVRSDMSGDGEELGRLLEKIYHERGFDLREYKETVLIRRLGRRLRARGAQTYASYARVLDQDPAEYDMLFNDLTINVTSFFRDDIAFRALGDVVLQALTARGLNNIRIWSAGCATGEEPYSIAMLLLQMLGEEIGSQEVSILATDVDAKALDCAREGRFAPKDVQGIRAAWLSRYFVPEGDGFRVRPALSRLVTFQAHNLASDPPYHDLDLVVCRNVLIYFAPTLQTRVLKSFHEGLREGGFLLLGKAEVPVGEAKALFDWVDSKAKLFRKTSRRRSERERRGKAGCITQLVTSSTIKEQAKKVDRVVVIAASAGGIDALMQVLSCLPADLPAAILIVQHLRSDRQTRLPEFLASHCALRVCLAQNRLPLEAGVVYVAVPGSHLLVESGWLILSLDEPVHYVRPAADMLFASAAQAFGPNVTGVVLSGSGRDGAHGCQVIKANGGMTIAQDERTSRHFAMPGAAIDAGAIDYVLPLDQIAGQIVALIHEAETQRGDRGTSSPCPRAIKDASRFPPRGSREPRTIAKEGGSHA